MNKKLLFGMFAAATMLMATSCQNDELDGVQSGKESVVSFTLEQPGIVSRAYSDGEKATKLSYAVYDKGTGDLVTKSEDGDDNQVTFSGKTATVNLRLVNGKTYDIIFWADNEDAPYTFNEDEKTISVNYDGITSQNEKRDAFFGQEKELTVNGSVNKTVYLKRPFAQLNIATTDHDEAAVINFNPTKSKITVSNVYKTLNLLTGVATDKVENLVYDFADIPEGEDFPVEEVAGSCRYLSMNYLLVKEEQELVDIDLTVEGADGTTTNVERSYPSVPVQRNYRTNIYGKILTDPAAFNITINPEYTDNHNVSVWDGTSTTEVTEVDGVYYISNGAELAWVAQQTLAGTTFSGKQFVLTADIDLGNHPWTAIGSNVESHPGTTFAGTFDGDNHVISNLNVTDQTSTNASAGLFGTTTGTIQNVTVKNAVVLSSHWAGVIVGYVTQGVRILNCHVDGASVTSEVHMVGTKYDDGDKAGGIVGYANDVEVKGCSVTNTTIKGYRDLGGIAGYAGGVTVVSDCTVLENVKIIVDTKNGYMTEYTACEDYHANAIVGENLGEMTGCSGEATIEYLWYPNEGEAVIDGTVYNTLADAVTAVADGGVLVLGSGNFDLSSCTVQAGPKTLTIEGCPGGNAVLDVTRVDPNFSDCNLIFRNVTLKKDNVTDYCGMKHVASVDYQNCTFEGKHFLYSPAKFENCTFSNSEDYCVWTYGSSKAEFTDCIFNCGGKAVLIYTEYNLEAEHTFTDCTFNDNDNLQTSKAAIEIGESANGAHAKYTVYLNDCTVNGFAINPDGASTGTVLWGNKNSMSKDALTIVIDGTEVY